MNKLYTIFDEKNKVVHNTMSANEFGAWARLAKLIGKSNADELKLELTKANYRVGEVCVIECAEYDNQVHVPREVYEFMQREALHILSRGGLGRNEKIMFDQFLKAREVK